MSRFSSFHPLYMSFYSKPLYKDVAHHWKGMGFLYLFLLVAVFLIPKMFLFQNAMTMFIAEEGSKIANQFPTITITKGKVSIDKPSPYIITNVKDGSPFIIIDTTGKITSLDNSPAFVLITQTKLIMKKNNLETRVFDLSPINEFTLNRSNVYDFLDWLAEWLPFIVYPFALLFTFILRAIQVLLYALIGLFFAKLLNAALGYAALVRLSAIAITPAVILGTTLAFAQISIPFWGGLSFAIALGYLFFGIKAASQPDTA